MPLFARARIEVYLPDLPKPGYQDFLDILQREFTFAFGGCTTIRGLDGHYLSQAGIVIQDRVNLLYTDLPFALESDLDLVSRYADELLAIAFDALEEETVLVVIDEVYHSA